MDNTPYKKLDRNITSMFFVIGATLGVYLGAWLGAWMRDQEWEQAVLMKQVHIITNQTLMVQCDFK